MRFARVSQTRFVIRGIQKRGEIMHIYIPVGLIVGGYKLYKKCKDR